MIPGPPEKSSLPRVLHICSDFANQKVYPQLVKHLDAIGFEQAIYVPVRSADQIDRNRDDELTRAAYRYSHLLTPKHRLFFRQKVRVIVRDLLDSGYINSAGLVHAHFLYSDGAVALALHRLSGVPYTVSVRSTDINVFMRLRPDLKWLCRDIIALARSVVLLTPAYKDVLKRWLPRRAQGDFEKKVRVIPNGLAPPWLEPPHRQPPGECLRLLYVGDFSKNKNVKASIEAAARLNEERPTVLTLVGGGGDGEKEIVEMLASEQYRNVHYAGRIDDPGALREVYRGNDIFVMPSFRETFGVAYLEALSQGLPIVYTKGQGVDGYFPEQSVGRAVDPHRPDEIKEAVLALAAELPGIRSECIARAREFAWTTVAGKYAELYQEALDGGAGRR